MHPARADDDHRAEARVPACADEQLEPGRRCPRTPRPNTHRPPRRSTAASSAASSARPSTTPPRVRLVQRAERLQHDRIAELCRGRRPPRRAPRPMRAAANGTPAAASAARASAYPTPATARRGAGSGGHGRRRSHVVDERRHRVDRRLDRAIHRDPRRHAVRAPAARPSTSCARRAARPVSCAAARELGRDRELALAQLVRERAVAAEVRREEHRVDVARLEQRARRAREAERVLLPRAREVDRVRGRRGRRQRRTQRRPARRPASTGSSRSCAPSRSLATAPYPPPSPITATRRPRGRSAASSACSVSTQPPRCVDAVDAGRTARRVDRIERARERTGVRASRARRRLGAARPSAARPACPPSAPPRRTRARRGSPRSRRRSPSSRRARRDREHVGDVEVGLVADRREPREAEPDVGEQQPGLERDVAALRDEPDRPGRQRVRREVELARGVEHAEAVRAEQDGARRAHPRDDARARAPRRRPPRSRRSPSRPRRATRRPPPRARPPARSRTTSSGASGQLRQRPVHRQPVQLAAAPPDEVDAYDDARRAPRRARTSSPTCRDRPRRRRSASERGSNSGRQVAAHLGSWSTRSRTAASTGAARPIATSTCTGVCSAVAMGSGSPSRSSTCER